MKQENGPKISPDEILKKNKAGQEFTPEEMANMREIAEGGPDERPSLEADYERQIGWVDDQLKNLTPADLGKAEKEIEDKILSGKHDDKITELDNLKSLIKELGKYMVLEKKEEIISRMAKTDLFKNSDAFSKVSEVSDEKIRNALYNFTEAAQFMARSRFPKEYDRQFEQRDEEKKEELQRMREENKNFNVR